MDAPVNQPESPYELSRQIQNLARVGTVAEVRLAAPARVRVKTGGNVTGWLPWLTHRAGGSKEGRKWYPPVVGEQVLLICPGGDLGRGVALLGIYSDARPQGSTDAACERTDWDADNRWQFLDGALTFALKARCFISMDRGSTTLELLPDRATIKTPQAAIEIGPGGKIVLRGGGAELTVGPSVVTSNVDIISGAISAQKHVHGGVTPGGSVTSVPQ